MTIAAKTIAAAPTSDLMTLKMAIHNFLSDDINAIAMMGLAALCVTAWITKDNRVQFKNYR